MSPFRSFFLFLWIDNSEFNYFSCNWYHSRETAQYFPQIFASFLGHLPPKHEQFYCIHIACCRFLIILPTGIRHKFLNFLSGRVLNVEQKGAIIAYSRCQNRQLAAHNEQKTPQCYSETSKYSFAIKRKDFEIFSFFISVAL